MSQQQHNDDCKTCSVIIELIDFGIGTCYSNLQNKFHNYQKDLIKWMNNRDRVDDRFLPIEFMHDRSFVVDYFKKFPHNFESVADEFKNDKQVIKEVVRNLGCLLTFASDELKNDREVVLEAVKQDGSTLQYASNELRNDHEIVLEAVKQEGEALEYASNELRNDN
ncbi:predicted protein [Naegleria gruberi]|uniref:Predicted protein n=1 Tax=Naegleria gruberi TaxID=5762 RepID=D2V7V9_NAEGR|nr:uncharacterized protein NAEGRDRAFT_64940 [Naegleria gruberi]EFC47071.1 predicted protein [Naegleria gruberi]|eukprot:XP_002679815.1 predicted protein [Naegleria gruberi strain NEG-M]